MLRVHVWRGDTGIAAGGRCHARMLGLSRVCSNDALREPVPRRLPVVCAMAPPSVRHGRPSFLITAHARSHVDGPLLLLSLWRLAMLVLSVMVVVVMVLLLVGAMNSRDCGARANRRAKRVHRVHRTARRTAPRHHRIQHHAVDVS